MGQLSKALEGIDLPEETKALVAKADDLLSAGYTQASYMEYLEAEIKRLKKESGISGESNGLTFNQRTGTHTDSNSDIHYCTKCLSDNKRSPLRRGDYGWSCLVCTTYYQNPDRPPPVIGARRPTRI